MRKAGDHASAKPILSATEDVPAGANVTVVAALTAAGEPACSRTSNDTAAVEAGSGRLIVRHTAAAPEVDVYAGDATAISSLANGGQEALTVPVGNVAAKVTVAGEDEAVPGPADLPVDAGMATVVLAVGSAEDGNLAVLTQSTRWAARPALRGRAAAAWPAPVPPPPSGRNRAVGLVLAAAGDPP